MNIRFVTKYSYLMNHTQVKARGHYDIVVYYESKHRRFSDSETLPKTVVDFMLNASKVKTVIREDCKAETYYKQGF